MGGDAAVIAGVAQVTHRDGNTPLDPLSLMVQAGELVLNDACDGDAKIRAKLARILDGVCVVNVTSWQYPGGNERLPHAVAERLGLGPRITEYTSASGDSPQRLVNDAAAQIERGGARAFLLLGGEGARSASRIAAGTIPKPSTWPEMGDGVLRHAFPRSRLGAAYGILRPTEVYPFFETALRATTGRAPHDHALHMGRLFSGFSAVAASNPFAWFNTAHQSADQIASVSKGNRMIVYPYTKRMNAFPTVDMAAGVLVIGEAEARRLGIKAGKFVHVMGGAGMTDLEDHFERRYLYESPSMRLATGVALRQAGLSLPQIDLLDLYSCFPSAVQVAQRELGLSQDDPRPLTVTGGLPFNGGPFNNYVMHAIATVVTRLRGDSSVNTALVLANGGYLTKHAVGVYGRKRGRGSWREAAGEAAKLQQQIDDAPRFVQVDSFEGAGVVDAYCVRYGHEGVPEDALVVVRKAGTQDLVRTLAYVDLPASKLHDIEKRELVGQVGTLTFDKDTKTNRFQFDLSRL